MFSDLLIGTQIWVHNLFFKLFLESLNIIIEFSDYVLFSLDDDNVLRIFNKNSNGI